MKKIVYFSGSLFGSITLLSIFFKILHLQGAQTLFLIGIVGLAVIFIPSYAKYKHSKNNQK